MPTNDNQVLPTSTEPMSEAKFLNKRTNCPENPDSTTYSASGKARSDHKQNNRSKSNNDKTDVKTEPMNPNGNVFYSPNSMK